MKAWNQCTCVKTSEGIDCRPCDLHKVISPDLSYDFRGEPPYGPAEELKRIQRIAIYEHDAEVVRRGAGRAQSGQREEPSLEHPQGEVPK